MIEPSHIFNRSLVKLRKSRVAARFEDFLKRELTLRLCERLEEVRRHFPLALDLGCHNGTLAAMLEGSPKIATLVQCDMAEPMLRRARGLRVLADEEALPFAQGSFDAVLSVGSLHWVNDLPGTLVQIRRMLKPDGLFLAMLPGAQSLRELRESFAAVEARSGAIRPHLAPLLDVRDAGNLLTRAGFALPVADSDTLSLSYTHPMALLRDLQAMGETNALLRQEKGILPRSLFPEICAHYQQHFPAQTPERIRATLELITLTAWAPHESQPKPLARGSGQIALGSALKGEA